MKWNNKFTQGLSFILLLGSACTEVQDEVEINRPDKQGTTVSLTVTTQPLQTSGIITRSEGKGMDLVLGDSGEALTRAIEEDKIENICILQFEGAEGASDAVLKAKIYLNEYDGRNVELNLEPSASCFLYVCANVGDITTNLKVFSSTFQELIDASYAISNGQATFDPLLPMSGCSDVFNTTTLTGDIAISLTRMVAKVTFVCDLSVLPASTTFDITSVKLRNVPKHIGYYGDNSSDANVDTYIGVDANVAEQTTTYTWIMPENRAGDAQNTVTYWTERFIKNAPLYATYIELTGNYTTSGGDVYETTYVVYLGDGENVNNYDVVRNHHYTITSQIKGINTVDQRVTLDTNLSADGLANCYLAGKDDHWYRFNGSVMGNGNDEDYAAATYGLQMLPDGGVNIAGVAKAFVMWETADGLIKEIHWDDSSGCVRFKTGDAKGNALIAVANGHNEVLWSWHIWRTNNVDLATLNEHHTLNIKTNTALDWYEAFPDVGVGKGRIRSLGLMDRNLGAAFDGELDFDDCKGANCLHYQFGRKDPFPAGKYYRSSQGGESGQDVTLYGNDRTGERISFNIAEKVKPAPGSGAMSTILNTIKNPEVFYFCYGNPWDWISTSNESSDDRMISNCLWGDENRIYDNGHIADYNYMDPDPWDGKKTIYDPSPAGWRVAPPDVWTGLIKEDIGVWTNLPLDNIYRLNTWTDNAPWGHMVYFNNNEALSTFLPASGCRYVNDGVLYNAGYYGYTWYSSSIGKGALERHASGLQYNKDRMYVLSTSTRGSGLCVRCVRE